MAATAFRVAIRVLFLRCCLALREPGFLERLNGAHAMPGYLLSRSCSLRITICSPNTHPSHPKLTKACNRLCSAGLSISYPFVARSFSCTAWSSCLLAFSQISARMSRPLMLSLAS
ncbi:hypothetical protein BC831DRAFT_489940 [Entophlyctis helioformis]|nr:hypothetical protein BC831DRAFT_489940 [Entophlyctis helioformis]